MVSRTTSKGKASRQPGPLLLHWCQAVGEDPIETLIAIERRQRQDALRARFEGGSEEVSPPIIVEMRSHDVERLRRSIAHLRGELDCHKRDSAQAFDRMARRLYA